MSATVPEDTDWGGLAGRYDLIVRLFDQSYPEVRRRLAHDLRGAERVLEIGAGTGQFTFDLARVASAVVATDYAQEMVDGIRARVAEHPVDTITTNQMNAYDIDFGDGAFDGVFCANGLHIMEHPNRALTEMRRVLRRDGVLVVPTFLHGAGRLEVGLSRTLSVFSSFVAYHRLSLEELVGLVENAGFRVTCAVQLPGLFPIGYVAATPA